MNWKLIFLLSGFGLVMGIATVFLIPSKIEPMFWLAIFIVCAYFISKQTEKPFSHGLFVGLANSVWITASHILFFNQYIANHPWEEVMMSSVPLLGDGMGTLHRINRSAAPIDSISPAFGIGPMRGLTGLRGVHETSSRSPDCGSHRSPLPASAF